MGEDGPVFWWPRRQFCQYVGANAQSISNAERDISRLERTTVKGRLQSKTRKYGKKGVKNAVVSSGRHLPIQRTVIRDKSNERCRQGTQASHLSAEERIVGEERMSEGHLKKHVRRSKECH